MCNPKNLFLFCMQETLVYGVDPGTTKTGWVAWNGKQVVKCGISSNEEFLEMLKNSGNGTAIPMYVEMVACYGMPVGKETFETVAWIGRFIEVWDILEFPWHLCYRIKIKSHHCHSARAKDANISQAIRDKYGKTGTIKNPGPLFGVKSHIWSALAVATYAVETNLIPTCLISEPSDQKSSSGNT